MDGRVRQENQVTVEQTPTRIGDNDTDNSNFIVEGSAKLDISSPTPAFYNPAQQFNRDLTILVLQQFVEDRRKELEEKKCNGQNGDAEPPIKRSRKCGVRDDSEIRILDALSASGLRAIRFAKEVPFVAKIIANDFSEQAVSSMNKNIEMNGVQNLVESRCGDAVDAMMSNRSFDKRFHAIDIDPYGSASMFLSSAVQAVTDKGILMVTCTDMAVLCGNTPESCYNKYGSVGLRHKSCHEFAIRVLLRAIDTHANCYGRYIEPLLSVSIDYYLRVFVRLHTSAFIAKDSVMKVSHVFACTGCHSLHLQPLVKKITNGNSIKYTPKTFDVTLLDKDGKCVHCKQSVHMAGPIYSAPIHNQQFVNKLLQRLKTLPEEKRSETYLRTVGVLTVIAEELSDIPLYYEYDQLMHVVKSAVPKAVDFRSALMNAGYRCSISHCNPKAIKTDAPTSFLWDIARTVAKNNNVTSERFTEDCAGKVVLEQEIKHEIVFRMHPEALEKSKIDSLLRFQQSKGKNMGPKAKTKGSVSSTQAGFQIPQQAEKK
ncbi:N2,N2-dimethylguanosine tRNA methyltransferase [Loa loa]|uniref:tRNA (guanine(26)-N(2))-dimethyltransferase n=1 Tax=Loa loa TaxID=7209 RepID=A0A1I7VFH3_LOALO|nr:N2,N2-dimethylguanosine tRNA methyltransferase [Loa loa]EFO26160.1 N2,N2-dimethylguanosine tRNA methyltransferase [Loa loa]